MKSVFAGILLLLHCVAGSSQSLARPADVYLQSIQKLHIVPGFSVVVVKGDRVIFSKGYGIENTPAHKPFTSSTILAVGSLTKSFTALAALKLVERGKLSLDTPVVHYLPWFQTANKDRSDKITMRMLLSNTSGLYPPNTNPLFDKSDTAIESFVKNLSSIYLYREPGNSYEYSNTAFVVAGLVISKVSGLSYAGFLEKEIFLPLGMKHTSTDTDNADRLDIDQGYYPSIKSAIAAKREPEFETGEYAPAGSLLHSCANDMGKYLLALVNDNKIVTGSVKKDLWTSNTEFPGLSKRDGGDDKPFSYGMGWMISYIEGRTIIHHGGSTGRTSSFTMIDTVNKIAACILMNIDMTFIDKYSYPTEFTILNNVLRLEESRPASAYGKPVEADPTLNNYELNEDQKNKYIGEYKHRSGRDAFVYYGVNMRIQKTETGGLEEIIFRGNQTVNRFALDFVNESVAVSRNIDMPGYIKFKLTPAGVVTGSFLNNIEFTKQDNSQDRFFQQVTDAYRSIRFNLPLGWKYNADAVRFSATGGNNKALLTGGLLPKENFSLDGILKSGLDSAVVLTDGSKIISENTGTFIWQQKTFRYQKNNADYQCVILVTKNSRSGFWFILSAPKAEFTTYIQQVVNPLLKSFRIKGNLE